MDSPPLFWVNGKGTPLKIAVTADLHLSAFNAHPERYRALENILHQMIKNGIYTLIIAGDLFHESTHNYSEFEALCKREEYKNLHLIIIPGNHDSLLTNKLIAADNIEVVSEQVIKTFDSAGTKFLFLPYRREKTMGEVIAGFGNEFLDTEWVLIGHGDWMGSMYQPNPLEPGTYMPLSRTDIERFKPSRVILGHIHKPLDIGIIHYPGSPCPLDITETGKRRFLIVDSKDCSVISQPLDSDFIFFDESLVIIPTKDEEKYLKDQINAKMRKWGIKQSEKSKVILRIKVRGYTSDKRRLMEILKDSFREFNFYQDGEPDISDVYTSDDIDRAEIANRVSKEIEKLEWIKSPEEPSKEEILLEALRIIYGD